jgi:hypothetical protein
VINILFISSFCFPYFFGCFFLTKGTIRLFEQQRKTLVRVLPVVALCRYQISNNNGSRFVWILESAAQLQKYDPSLLLVIRQISRTLCLAFFFFFFCCQHLLNVFANYEVRCIFLQRVGVLTISRVIPRDVRQN